MKFLLILLLLVPTTIVAQFQGRPPQVDTLITVVAAVDSAQQRYFAEHGNFAAHPDSLATVGLKLLWNRPENKVLILPWRVEMTAIGRRDTPPKPQSWKVVLVFQSIMCWYPEKEFGPLPRHVDIKGVPGLACGLDPRKPAAVTKISSE